MTIFAMTREMGTQGNDIAFGVAEKLGLEVVHHELVERDIAGKVKLGESDVHRFLEGKASLWERWNIDKKRLSNFTAEEVLELANKGNVIIRGWGATTLLRRVPHVICVRVCSPLEMRIGVMLKRLEITDRSIAKREINESDAAHTRTIQSFSDIDWENPINYDLVLNTERLPIADGVNQMLQLAKSSAFEETDKSRQILADLLIETKIKNRVSSNGSDNRKNGNCHVLVSDGVVVLSGLATARSTAEAITTIARQTPGVRRVENNIVVAPSHSQWQI